jgi:hypothetical protein
VASRAPHPRTAWRHLTPELRGVTHPGTAWRHLTPDCLASPHPGLRGVTSPRTAWRPLTPELRGRHLTPELRGIKGNFTPELRGIKGNFTPEAPVKVLPPHTSRVRVGAPWPGPAVGFYLLRTVPQRPGEQCPVTRTEPNPNQ